MLMILVLTIMFGSLSQKAATGFVPRVATNSRYVRICSRGSSSTFIRRAAHQRISSSVAPIHPSYNILSPYSFRQIALSNPSRCLGGFQLFSARGVGASVNSTNAAAPKAPEVEISPSDHGTKPLLSFSQKSDNSGNIDKRLLKVLAKDKITAPTPIQAHAMPLLLLGHDVMASAQTGSGKTLMFSLPLADRLLRNGGKYRRGSGSGRSASPAALVLSPTRELAQQTANVLRRLTSNTPLRVSLATGGSDSKAQRRSMLGGCDILVGTPGRVLQFVDERSLRLQGCAEVVVDEADRMLDLGFEPQLRRIARALGHIRPSDENPRHTILCSATFPPDVQRLAADFLRNSYYFLAAGRVGAAVGKIDQELRWVDGGPNERRKVAVEVVRRHHSAHRNDKPKSEQRRVVVFTNTKDDAERMGSALGNIKGGIRVVHGDKQQKERNMSLQAFRDGKVNTLVATDVAARGLDVPEVGLVVQADAPRDADSYVHRVGRTGRAGKSGHAIALIDGRSVSIAPDLVRLLEEAEQDVPPWLLGMSHVATARTLEQEGAIAAGGGGSLDKASISSPTSSSGKENEEQHLFTGQDFRSTAAAGTWGSERDTSYRSFDEEAYKSLDDIPIGESVDPPNGENKEGDAQDKSDDDIVEEAIQAADEEADGAFTNMNVFERKKPSKQLKQAMKRFSGTEELTDKPNAKVLAALSKRGADQRLRFEYLGLFPFSELSCSLKTRGANRMEGRRGNMPHVLMVAEKPSIAKAIADALCSNPNGARQRRGISRALPVYEFTSNAFGPSQVTEGDSPVRSLVTVTSVVGHVFGLGFDEERSTSQDGRRSFNDPSSYFRMPVVKQEEGTSGKLRVVEHLRALAAESDHVVLWLDCDPEGENIAHEVIGVVRRSLEQKAVDLQKTDPDAPPARRIHRARFSAITKEALRDAFSNLQEPDAALSRSVDARQELDLRVGVAMTRLLTWKCVGLARRKFSPATRLVSYGPCQTPALSLCVDRAREIKAFKPADYWKLHITAKAPAGKRSVPLKWKVLEDDAVEGRRRSLRSRTDKNNEDTRVVFEDSATYNEHEAKELASKAKTPGTSATVVRVNHITERMNPPLGLNTVALLSAGSKAMGMSPKQVMNVAEKLYGAGFISYPRTETTRYDPKGFDARQILRQHTSHPEWGKTAAYLLNTKYAKSGRPPVRGRDVGDHPPITTLKSATRDQVGGGREWRVYEYITRHFLGSLSDELSYVRHVAELELDCASDSNHTFELEQTEVDKLGFAGACRWVLRDIGAAKPGEGISLKERMVFPISEVHLESCATRPPPFLQEHELIELMDQNRIGTDASMAQHVNNIVDRQYVVLCDETGEQLRPPRPPIPGRPRPPRQIGRYLVPTSLGSALIDLFGEIDDDDPYECHEDIPYGQSMALLARPSIRAQMEREVAQIATGELEKAEVVAKNLEWFEARHSQLEESLKSRTGDFAASLMPVKASLNLWRRLGVFEKPSATHGGQQNNRRGGGGRKKAANGKKSGPRTLQNKRHQGSGKSQAAKRCRNKPTGAAA